MIQKGSIAAVTLQTKTWCFLGMAVPGDGATLLHAKSADRQSDWIMATNVPPLPLLISMIGVVNGL